MPSFARGALFAALVALTSAGLAPRAAAVEPARGVGLDLAGIDHGVAPGDDFFRYANGAWLKTTEIPADRPAYGPGAILAELTTQRTVELLRRAAKASPGSEARKAGDFYASLLDEAAIEARGLAPLQPALDRIARIAGREDLARALGETLRADVDALNATDFETDNVLGLWIAQDLDDPTRYAAFLLQGGLDMPDREYYLDPSPRMEEIRTRHLAHVTRVLELARVPDAAAKAARVVGLERRIAEAHATREDSADVRKANNHWPRAQFAVKAPGLDWRSFFDAAGLSAADEFVVWHPGAVTGLAALAAREPLENWKEYLVFHALEHHAHVLPRAFGEERFAFHGTVLSGIPVRREPWKRAVDATSEALGEAVGRLYVEQHFPPAAKTRIEEMVRNLVAAFGRRIDALEWMAPATKARAREKLAVLRVGVGYPEAWRDYSALEVAEGDAFGNAVRAELFEYRRNLAKLGRPVDRSEWMLTPQTVNAVNLPAMNALNFPAAILQPPFFDPERPLAMDYGSIGAIIGHEVSHSFDDQGSQFDAAGRLRNWWTDADREHFDAAAKRLVQQYDAYRPFPDLRVNGTLTLGENIADVAGLAAAYDAFQLSLAGAAAPELAGLTGDQQFFLSFAQSWRSKAREAALRQQVIQDGHAPAEYRADTVRNLDTWYAAFGVRPGQALALAPGDRVRVW